MVTANATLLREKRSMVGRKDCSPRTKLSFCHHRVHRSLLADCSQSRKAAVDPKRGMRVEANSSLFFAGASRQGAMRPRSSRQCNGSSNGKEEGRTHLGNRLGNFVQIFHNRMPSGSDL